MTLIETHWPLIALALWLAYKGWNARRVMAMLPALQQEGATWIDLRSAAEFASGCAPGTVNIPLNELSQRLREIPRTTAVATGCASGTRSGMAKMILKKNGDTRVYNIGSWCHFIR